MKTEPERTIIEICIIIIISEIDNITLEFERWNFWVIKRLISGPKNKLTQCFKMIALERQ